MIPVIWHYVRWQGCTALINDWFSGSEFEHFETMKDASREGKGVVMVIHGDHERTKVAEILNDLKGFKNAFCIVIGESGEFPIHILKSYFAGSKVQIWTQSPDFQTLDEDIKVIPLGYPPDCPLLLSPHDVLSVDREYDWFFAGQVSHSHRKACVSQLRNMKNGHLLETGGFWQGMERPEYYKMLTESKIIPCPSGPETPDTFRIWEALEAGCVPIVDRTCPKREGVGFWKRMFGAIPFPTIEDWDHLSIITDTWLKDWEPTRDFLYRWWLQYKQDIKNEAILTCQKF